MKYSKNCKRCGGKSMYQIGGPAPLPTLQQANMEAKRFATARGLVSGENTYVDHVPQYLTPQGTPFNSQAGVTSTFVPPSITRDQIQANNEGIYSYPDPNTGDLIPVNSSVLSLPRFQNKGSIYSRTPAAYAMRMKGGYLRRMQQGGLHGIPQESQDEMIQRSLSEFNTANPTQPGELPVTADPIQDMINKGLLDTPNNYSNPQQWYNDVNQPGTHQGNMDVQFNPQLLGAGIMQGTNLLSEVSGRVARGRQNQYDYKQQTALGQMNPIQASDFQPSPYSLYAKYGGKLKTYQQGGIAQKAYYDRMKTLPQAAPSYNFSALQNNPNEMDSTMYGIQFQEMLQNDPTALYNYAMYQKYGTAMKNPNGGSTDMGIYNSDTNRINAYQDALSQQGKAGAAMISPMSYRPEMKYNKSVAPLGYRRTLSDLPKQKKGGNWIQGAINPAHKGWCTPLSNPHCTGARRRLALTFKKHHGFHKKK